MHSLTIAFQHTCIFFLFAKEKLLTNSQPVRRQNLSKTLSKASTFSFFFMDLLHLFFNSSLVSGIDRLLQLTKAPQGPNPPPCVELGFRRPDKKIREESERGALAPQLKTSAGTKSKREGQIEHQLKAGSWSNRPWPAIAFVAIFRLAAARIACCGRRGRRLIARGGRTEQDRTEVEEEEEREETNPPPPSPVFLLLLCFRSPAASVEP
jgi:hypothetical protein